VLYERRVELKSLALKRLGKLYYVFHNYLVKSNKGVGAYYKEKDIFDVASRGHDALCRLSYILDEKS